MVRLQLGAVGTRGNRGGQVHRNAQDADMRVLASRARHERPRLVPVDSELQTEKGLVPLGSQEQD